MPTNNNGIYQRNGIWYIDFVSSSGKRIRRSAKTKDRREAEELRDKLKHESWRTSELGEKLNGFGMKQLFVGLKKNRRKKVLRTILQNCEGLRASRYLFASY